MRKLATIQTVKEVESIEGADFIALASMVNVGWKCVVKKSDIKAGDKVVYFEIDSLLPMQEPFLFLQGGCSVKTYASGKSGFYLKTKKLKGKISQGLMLPIIMFPELSSSIDGEEVSEQIGVIQYEPAISASLQGMVKGNFPGFFPKSDQERIQNLMQYFTDAPFNTLDYEMTIKMDGSSCSMYLKDGVFGVCSRNLDLKETENNSFWKTARMLKMEEKMRKIGMDFMVQGELMGEGIQKNPEKLKGHDFFIYNIFDISKQVWLDFDERKAMMDRLNDGEDIKVKHVPVIGVVKAFEEWPTLEKMLEVAEGPSYNNSVKREGLVFKSRMIDGEIIQFKVISNSYLLKLND